MVRGISLEVCLLFRVKLCQDQRSSEHVLQLLKGCNLGWVPVPGFVLSCELSKQFSNLRIVYDEPTIEVTKARESLQLLEILVWFPVSDRL